MIYNHNKFFFDYMDIEVMESSKNEVNLSIKGGDLGILYIIQNELLSDPKTEYAGVITRHPLTNEIWVRVASSNPIKDILKATDSAIAEANKHKSPYRLCLIRPLKCDSGGPTALHIMQKQHPRPSLTHALHTPYLYLLAPGGVDPDPIRIRLPRV